jgi:hypothetical protein
MSEEEVEELEKTEEEGEVFIPYYSILIFKFVELGKPEGAKGASAKDSQNDGNFSKVAFILILKKKIEEGMAEMTGDEDD